MSKQLLTRTVPAHLTDGPAHAVFAEKGGERSVTFPPLVVRDEVDAANVIEVLRRAVVYFDRGDGAFTEA